MKNAKQKAEARGRRAEWWACWYLRAKGYRILAKRFRSNRGEIDLIAKRGGTMVFVEVKARKTVDDAAWSIAYKQRRRIEAAAQDWLKKYKYGGKSLRFDVVAIVPATFPTHITSAWRIGE